MAKPRLLLLLVLPLISGLLLVLPLISGCVGDTEQQPTAAKKIERLGGVVSPGPSVPDEQIVAVYLSDTKAADHDLVCLESTASLQGLDLGRTQVTDAGLVHLEGLTQLRFLDLAGTQVSDAGLSCLTHLKSLRQLDLSQTKITDAGLTHLKGLTGLQLLVLEGTLVSGAGIEELRKALPELRIVWQSEIDPRPDAEPRGVSRPPLATHGKHE